MSNGEAAKPSLVRTFTKGLFEENPSTVLLLGMCPTLAVTSSAVNGFGMGVATTFVLVGSNIFVSLLGRTTPHKIRVPVFIVLIAAFTTIADLFIEAYSPTLSEALGIFIPLIVVNCIVLGRAEMFASKNNVVPTIADALGMGLGFTSALTVLGTLRELLGHGTVFGFDLCGAVMNLFGLGGTYQYDDFLMAIMPPGAFVALGLMTAIVAKLRAKPSKKAG